MTNRLLAPAPYARFQTSGRSYTADLQGIIAAAAIGDVIDLIRSGCSLLPDDNNFTAVKDPTELNDQIQGFSVGSRWFNTMGGRAWVCLSAASDAATWILDGVVPGTGVEPSNMLAYFGGGPALFSRKAVLFANSAIRLPAIVRTPPTMFWRVTPCRPRASMSLAGGCASLPAG